MMDSSPSSSRDKQSAISVEGNSTSATSYKLSATHDTSRIGWHMEDLAALAKNVEAAVSASFPNHGGSRYRSVNVGMMRWECQTLTPFEAGIEHEFNRLGDVFEQQYGFNVQNLIIRANGRSHNTLMSQALGFIDDFDSKENLFILYYAGHGYINDYRQSTWAFSQAADSPTVDWSHIQGLFERADSDVLVILDCCAAASAAASAGPKTGTAFMETIAACGFEGRAPPPGEHSFTNSLIEVLEDWNNVPSFSIAMLHSEVFRVVMQRRKERCSNGLRLEWRSTPVHISNCKHPREVGIELCKRSLIDVADFPTTRSTESIGNLMNAANYILPSTYLDLMSLSCEALDDRFEIGAAPEQLLPEYSIVPISANNEPKAQIPKGPELKLPHMLISVELDQDQSLPNSEACRRWISSFPGLAKHVKVEGIYQGYSTVLVLSIPIAIWSTLPDHPACRPITYVTSRNLLQESQSQYSSSAVSVVTPQSDSSSVSEPNFGHAKSQHPPEKPLINLDIASIRAAVLKPSMTTSIATNAKTSTVSPAGFAATSNTTPHSYRIANTSRRRTGYILPERKRRGISQSVPQVQHALPIVSQTVEALDSQKGVQAIVEQSSQKFTYSPLAPGKDIRLLLLHRGTSEDGLSCQLVACALPSIPYEALSYTWGSEVPSMTIEVLSHNCLNSARDERKRLWIRPTLHAALVQLRSTVEDVALWVDALCINQDDVQERSQQVSRMHEIYSEASNVCIWLGQEGVDSIDGRLTFSFIREMLDLRRLDQLVYAEDKASQWLGMAKLLRHRWFSRVWTVQEVGLAKEATVHYGKEVIQWTDFRDAIALFVANFGRVRSLQQKHDALSCHPNMLGDLRVWGANTLVEATSNLFRRSADGTISERLLSLESLVSAFIAFEVSEPRDRIFAVLPIANDTASFGPSAFETWTSGKDTGFHLTPDTRVLPDYSKSLGDVYTDFVDFCVEKSKSLDIICRHWGPISYEQEKVENLPSWIPSIRDSAFGEPGAGFEGRINGDSFVGIPNRNQHNYNASGGCSPFAIIDKHPEPESKHGTILLKGIILDLIEKLTPRAVQGIIHEEALNMGGWKHDNPLEKVPEALWRTLVADRGPNGTSAPSWYYRACLECLMNVTQNGDLNTANLIDRDSIPSTVSSFLRRVQEVVWNRKFLLSKGGRNPNRTQLFGLAPTRAQEGDFICILFGCSVPVILRKLQTRSSSHYRLIGEAYIHGMMDGEALSDETPEYPYDEYETFVLH